MRNKHYINDYIFYSIKDYLSLADLKLTVNRLIRLYGEDAYIEYKWYYFNKIKINFRRIETDEETVMRLMEISKSVIPEPPLPPPPRIIREGQEIVNPLKMTPSPPFFNKLLFKLKNLCNVNRCKK